MLKALRVILFWYFACFIQVTNTTEVEQETREEPSHANAYQGDTNNFDDNGFPSAAFHYPLPARLNPRTSMQHYNTLENGYPTNNIYANEHLSSSILSNKDSADADSSMMRGQLQRYVIPPPDPRKPAKFQPNDYFLRDQRDYEKAPGIKDPKKFVHPKPTILDIKPYKCMNYTLSDIDNAWMTIYGENLGRNDLRDVGGITIVAGEHEFPCSNIVIGPPPPRRPPISQASTDVTNSTGKDEDTIDELDEIGINNDAPTQQNNNSTTSFLDISGRLRSFLERIANKLTVTRDEGDQNSNSLDQLVANIESPNNSSNASFITEDPSTAYKDDPKIFHKDSKSIRMLSCKVPNAFVYENQQSGFKIGYVKVVSNSMGPSEPPSWKKDGRIYQDGKDAKESTYCICDCKYRKLNVTKTTTAPATIPAQNKTTTPALPATKTPPSTTTQPPSTTSSSTTSSTTTSTTTRETTTLRPTINPDIPPCRMIGPRFKTNDYKLKSPCVNSNKNNFGNDPHERAMKALKMFVKLLHKYPIASYQIEGHTDEIGDEATNVVLGKKRAEKILELILTIAKEEYSDADFSSGLQKRLKTISYGETRPLVSNKLISGGPNQHGLSINRRVEFLRTDNIVGSETCEDLIIGDCARVQYGHPAWKPTDYDDDVMKTRCEQSSGDATGGDTCIYATQDEENSRLNEYMLQNIVDEKDFILSNEMNALLQSKIDLQRPRLCYSTAWKTKYKDDETSNSEIECDFCNIASPDIKFRKGKSAYDDSFEEPIRKIVNLLRQNKRMILKIVGRNDLIDGRHGHGHHDHLYSYNDDDDGERHSETHQNLNDIHNDQISGVQRNDFDGNEEETDVSFIDVANNIPETVEVKLASGDLGQKRAIAIRNKMIEIDSALENRIKVEESNANIAHQKTISSVNDYHHILFIRIDAICIQEFNKCPYNIEVEKISQSRKNNNDCRNTLHTMFSNYVLPTKMNCEVFEGCKYYDSQTMTESMRRTYLNHEKKIRDINKDVDLNMASNSSVFSPHLKVLPSCVHVASQKETCTINKLCKDECNCFKCTDVTKPKCNTKTEILVAYLPNKMNGLTLNDRCCKTWECRPRRPIIEDECKDVCCAELVNAKSKAKRRSRDNAHCNNYKPTCAAHQSLATFEKDKLAPTLKERCCPRYKCEDTPVTTTIASNKTIFTTTPSQMRTKSIAPSKYSCESYVKNEGCVKESSIVCKKHESKLTIDKNTTSNILNYKCCKQYICFTKPAECKSRKINCLHDVPAACHSKGGTVKLLMRPNVTSDNMEMKCCGIERCHTADSQD